MTRTVASEPAVPVMYLDIDGTVRHGKDELGRFVNGPEDVVVFPEAAEMMRRWKAAGGRIIGVSNQGGIALGLVPLDRVAAAMAETHRQTGDLFDRISWCYHHPNAAEPEMARCWCRKPSPGLLIESALDLARQHREFYPPHMGLMVGDRPEDEECARLAGLRFEHAAAWRTRAGLPKDPTEPTKETSLTCRLCEHPCPPEAQVRLDDNDQGGPLCRDAAACSRRYSLLRMRRTGTASSGCVEAAARRSYPRGTPHG